MTPEANVLHNHSSKRGNMRCERCGAEMPDDARFCSACGNAFEGTGNINAPTAAGHQITTWPGSDIGLPPHGPGSLADGGQRFLARLIDFLIFLPLIVLELIFTSEFDRLDSSPLGGLITWLSLGRPLFWVSALYEVALVALRGQTVGKMALGTKVVRESSRDTPGWGTSILRWVSTTLIGLIPFIGLIDVLWLLWDKHRQCLHDKVAKTLVIRIR